METFADVISSPVPVLIDIYAEWCAPCKMMAPVLKQLKDQKWETTLEAKRRHERSRTKQSHRTVQIKAICPLCCEIDYIKTSILIHTKVDLKRVEGYRLIFFLYISARSMTSRTKL